MLPKVIYVMGLPGAGKGTQAEMLSQNIGYTRFSTGDAFRAIAKQDTELGRSVKETIENGYLAPPEMAAEVVIEAVREHAQAGNGLVFDGTPRTVREAELVDAFFEEQGLGKPLVIFLKVDKEDMIERNSRRRFCLGIKGDFPVISPEDEERCLSLGGTVGKRVDDEEEKFIIRWNEFIGQTKPVIDGYIKAGIAFEIDGKGTIEEVHKRVMDSIASLRK